jgi:hypothetical protein
LPPTLILPLHTAKEKGRERNRAREDSKTRRSSFLFFLSPSLSPLVDFNKNSTPFAWQMAHKLGNFLGILGHKFGELYTLRQNVGEIEWQILHKMLCPATFCLAKLFGEIDP